MMLAAIALAATLFAADGAQESTVARARELYNMHDFDAAIKVAEVARRTPGAADAAALILARAYLERFRETNDVFELAQARSLLTQVEPARLSARDRVEWLVGLGESLYLDGQFGSAAEIFDQALGGVNTVDHETKERLLDWWASALDERARTSAAREETYLRILRRMEEELRGDPHPATASYWLVVAADGSGDRDRAWDAAMSGWVRAPLAGIRAESLRTDLDRYVNQILIPERARRPGSVEESARTAAAMRADWEALKARWKNPQ
jgi:tetratricopeptide (TPR) repeat protein